MNVSNPFLDPDQREDLQAEKLEQRWQYDEQLRVQREEAWERDYIETVDQERYFASVGMDGNW